MSWESWESWSLGVLGVFESWVLGGLGLLESWSFGVLEAPKNPHMLFEGKQRIPRFNTHCSLIDAFLGPCTSSHCRV